MRLFARIAIMTLMLLCGSAGLTAPAWADCPDRPACTGCGCKGGPGYRGPNGQCVGFAQLDKVCGIPASSKCTFENAPGTGLNKSCALGLDTSEEE